MRRYSKGADPGRETGTGETPLIAAAAANHTLAVDALVEAGADVNAESSALCRTALVAAVVGPDRSCPPRHPPHFRPSFPEFNGIT